MNLTEVLALAAAALCWGWACKDSALFAGPRALLEKLCTVEVGPTNPALYDPLGLGWGRQTVPRNRLAGLILAKYDCYVCAGFDATVAAWILLHGLDQWRAGVVTVLAANGLHVAYQLALPAPAPEPAVD